MAILVDLFKEYEDERIVKYRFADVDKPQRTLVFDKQSETIQPEDGVHDTLFRAHNPAGRSMRPGPSEFSRTTTMR